MPTRTTIDEQNRIARVEAKFPNPVLGDMPIVTTAPWLCWMKAGPGVTPSRISAKGPAMNAP